MFDEDDHRAVLRRITDNDPRPPRAVDRAIPIELETVVLKAMAKLPAERYPSAREFADDLGRFLDDRPITARRPTALDRAAKWVRRHRAVTLTAVLGLALAVVGLAVSTAVIAQKHAETKAAYERERDRAREAAEGRAEAEDNYRRTRRAVDLFVELSDEELLDFPPARLAPAAAT